VGPGSAPPHQHRRQCFRPPDDIEALVDQLPDLVAPQLLRLGGVARVTDVELFELIGPVALERRRDEHVAGHEAARDVVDAGDDVGDGLEHSPLDDAAEGAAVAPGVEVFALGGLVELGVDVAVRAQVAGEVELRGLNVAQYDLVAVEREAESDLPEPAAEVDRSSPARRAGRAVAVRARPHDARTLAAAPT
jgi:hypothetical protein